MLATSAGPEELAVLRDTLDAEELISAVTSAADTDRAKPHPDIVTTALTAQSAADPAEAIFLGDAVWDMKAARRAGVPARAVLSGGTSRARRWKTPAPQRCTTNPSMCANTSRGSAELRWDDNGV